MSAISEFFESNNLLSEMSDSLFLFKLKNSIVNSITVSRLAKYLDIESEDVCNFLTSKSRFTNTAGYFGLDYLTEKKYTSNQELSTDEINIVLKEYKKTISMIVVSKETLETLNYKLKQLEIAISNTFNAYSIYETLEFAESGFIEVGEVNLGRYRHKVSSRIGNKLNIKSKPNNCKTYTISFLTTKFYTHDLNSDDELQLKVA